MKNLVIKDFFESTNFKTDEERAKKIYQEIKDYIERDTVIVDFKDVGIIPTAFLNDSIGKIFLDTNIGIILKNLKIINIKKDDILLLKLVIDSALEMKK